MTFPLLGKSYFFACAAIAAQSREARCKNSRSAERGCSSVHPPPNRRRMGGGSNPAPPPTGYRRAIARSAVQKQPERRALRPQARFGAQPSEARHLARRSARFFFSCKRKRNVPISAPSASLRSVALRNAPAGAALCAPAVFAPRFARLRGDSLLVVGQGCYLHPFAACSAAGEQRNILALRSGCFCTALRAIARR